MKLLHMTVLVASAVLLSARSQAQTSDPNSADIRRVEFVGIYWGEPEAELKQALGRRGFEITLQQDSDPDFEHVVSEAIRTGRTAGSPSTSVIEARTASEEVRVEVGAFPDGPRVVRAEYQGGPEVVAAAKEKYSAAGLVRAGSDWESYFCLLQDKQVCAGAYEHGPSMPYITMMNDGRLTLRAGKNGEYTYEKLFQDAIKAKTADRKLSL